MQPLTNHTFNTSLNLSNRLSNLSTNDKIFYIVTFCIYLILLTKVGSHLNSETLRYDEAGQFFISQGLNHDSQPLSDTGDLADVLYNNARYNMDPGGYSILLHLWSLVSTQTVWSRLLSYIFFIGAIIFTILATHLITTSKKIALVSGLILFGLWKGAQAYEVRGYAMELCGIAYGIWMIFFLRKSISVPRLLYCALTLSIFITARYTMLMFGFIYGCFVMFTIVHHEGTWAAKYRQLIAFAAPLILTVCAIYFISLRIQTGVNLNPLAYISYFPVGKVLSIFLILTIGVFATWKWQPAPTREFLMLFLCVNIFFAIAGFYKLLPWTFYGHKGGPFTYYIYMAFIISAGGLIQKSQGQTKWAWIIMTVIILCILSLYRNSVAANVSPNGYIDKASLLRSIPHAGKNVIYVGNALSPSVRYLYEFGALKSDAAADGYPDNFYFFKAVQHNLANSADYANQTSFYELNKQSLEQMPSGSLYLAKTVLDPIPDDYVPVTNFAKANLFIKR